MEWGIRWGVEDGGGKIGVNLMKAETYLINRLGKGIIINIEQININKYRMKSSEPCSESVLERRPGLEKQLCEDQGQAWSYTARNHQFSLQIAGFNLAVRTISCLNNNLTLVAQYFYPNGKSLVLPSAYAEIFSAIANENAQNFHFFTQQDGKQLLLKCSLSSQPGLSTMDNIYQCLKYVQKSFPSFERALQALNLKSKNNRFSYKMLEQKLLLKKNIITAMNPSSAATQTQLFDSNQAQNSSVIRVKQVVEKKPEVFADQQPFSKKGGYFSVQRKNSIIHQFSGIQNQKQLAWKSPINLAQHRSVLESKMKKQIEYVSRIVDSKYLLTYYVSEAQPELIFMNYVPSLLKDYIYHEKAPFSQLLNFAKQLIQAVAVLHKSGVVHRDLKPENILIQGQSLKIIDYAESAMVDQTFDSQNFLGYTLPYSPFECSLGREEGFNRRQIDLWSVSIILYEMAFKSIPLFYTRWIGADILDMWRSTNDFSIFPLYRKRKGIPGIEEIISLISIRGIQMNPKQRISLLTYHRLISHLQEFYGSFKG